MKKRTWDIIGIVVLIFLIGWTSQFFYFDRLTKKLSLEGDGPVFTGRLSKNLEAVVSRPFVLSAGTQEFTFEPVQLKDWIEPYKRAFTGKTEYRIKLSAIEDDVRDFAPAMSIQPMDARLGIQDGAIVETQPSHLGQELNIEDTKEAIVEALIHDISQVQLVIAEKEPDISLRKMSELGITSLIAEGTSQFTGSPSSRVHNIKVGAKKFDSLLLAPGASFSFVDHLGDVDATTGYLPELVIKGTKVIPEYGGGLCQVSTTLFRAAIYAGLEINERKNHSFAIRYYSPVGFDATIYPGVTDLRFTNNTPASIYIQSSVVGSKITFSMFGASDNRKVTLDGPHSYDVLPDGSLKTIFTRTIAFSDGTQKKDTFRSTYKSPALFETIKNPLE